MLNKIFSDFYLDLKKLVYFFVIVLILFVCYFFFHSSRVTNFNIPSQYYFLDNYLINNNTKRLSVLVLPYIPYESYTWLVPYSEYSNKSVLFEQYFLSSPIIKSSMYGKTELYDKCPLVQNNSTNIIDDFYINCLTNLGIKFILIHNDYINILTKRKPEFSYSIKTNYAKNVISNSYFDLIEIINTKYDEKCYSMNRNLLYLYYECKEDHEIYFPYLNIKKSSFFEFKLNKDNSKILLLIHKGQFIFLFSLLISLTSIFLYIKNFYDIRSRL